MSEKILNTRIALKIDTLENWNSSTIGLKKGELAIATVAASAGIGLSEPVCMIKVGEDGVKTFSQLEWNLYAKASDVLTACKSEDALKAFVNGVINDAGIATNEALTTLAGRVTTAEGEIDTLQSEMDAVEAKAAANETAIGNLSTLVGDTAVATQIQNAIAALKLADTYDAKGAAEQALTDAKSYASSLNAAMDTRVIAVEGKAHEHANKAELDKITDGDVAKWNAAEQNAKDYADGLNTTMDGRVADLEALFGTGEGSVSDQIADAVATETEAREAADTALGNRVTAIENDYLKAADKTALQNQITANDGDITALQGLVGDTAVATQISTAVKEEADRAKGVESGIDTRLKAVEADYLKAADKTELTEAIATAKEEAIETILGGAVDQDFDTLKEVAEWIASDTTSSAQLVTRVSTAEGKITTLEGEMDTAQADIEAVEGRMDTAEGKITALEEASATHAKASDLTALTGRVTTVEGKVTTLEGEMDTAQADITALEGLVGEKAVSVQISEAIAAENLSQYAKAADLTEATGRITTVEGKVSTLESEMDTAQADIEALETEVAKKANDADLAAIAKTGNVNDLIQTEGDVLVFNCGTASTVI